MRGPRGRAGFDPAWPCQCRAGYDITAAASYLMKKGGYLCGSTDWAGRNDEGLVFAGKFQVQK